MPPIDVSSDESPSEDEMIPAKRPTPKTPREIRQPSPEEFMSDVIHEIPATKSISMKNAGGPEPMDEDNDVGDGSDEDDDGEEYVVENILDHRFDPEGVCRYLVKWKGWDRKSDLTWEPRAHLEEGANDILTEYHQKIGGKPVRREPVRRIRDEAFLNGPQSGGRRSRKSNSATGTPTAPEHRVDAWKPPAGSWEEHIQAIDTIEHDKRGLHVYVQWNDGRKSRHPTESIYKHAPQKMLHFYEQHLQFREGGAANGNDD